MAIYKYKVVDASGAKKQGKIEAQTKESAVNKLQSDGFTIVSCNEEGAMNKDINIIPQKIKPRDWSVF